MTKEQKQKIHREFQDTYKMEAWGFKCADLALKHDCSIIEVEKMYLDGVPGLPPLEKK